LFGSGVGELRFRKGNQEMKHQLKCSFRLALVGLSAVCIFAQSPQNSNGSATTTKTIQAIGYQAGGGSTKVDMKGGDAVPRASGEAKVQLSKGATNIEIQAKDLAQPAALGAEFLTYVAWAISPEGRASNIGELLINDKGEGKLKGTTELQTFSLVVTVEPYAAIRQPSELVALINEARSGTKGKLFVVKDYHLMRREQYQKLGNPLALTVDTKNVPLEMYEARNAVEIARSRAAEKYAPEIFTKAESSLKMAENSLAARDNRTVIVSTAKQAIQFSEDARALSVERQEQEQIENARLAAAAKARSEAEAKAAAEAEIARQKAAAEAKQQAELAAAKEAALKAQAEAEAARAQAAADLAAARAEAAASALKAREEAAKAEAERAIKAAADLRASLLAQFNRVLDTRDTVRGLVVNMGDVLFDTGKFTLKPDAREKLARLAGIVLAHEGLNLKVEGYTDNTGSDEFNQKLSEQRASAVQQFLLDQGLAAANVTSQGFGKAEPVEDNSTAEGRRKNRRVEIVVSGEVIGIKLGQ
jgi:outer membrane protein OmpA-like peptidoglycan-associated protein